MCSDLCRRAEAGPNFAPARLIWGDEQEAWLTALFGDRVQLTHRSGRIRQSQYAKGRAQRTDQPITDLRAPARNIELPEFQQGRVGSEKARQLQSPATGVCQRERSGRHEVGKEVLDMAAEPRSMLHRAWEPGQRSNQRETAPSACSNHRLRNVVQSHQMLLCRHSVLLQ